MLAVDQIDYVNSLVSARTPRRPSAERKTVYVLNIDGEYAPEIVSLTYPLIQQWAEKIGAYFQPITERRCPDYPVVYEKLQIGELSAENGDDWSIYIDSDTIVHPDLMDVTEHLSRDTVLHNGSDVCTNRWRRLDKYFRRDGRFIGACNWFAVASSWCADDFWHPLDDLTLEEAIDNISPTVAELKSGVIEPDHLLDDYVLSRNIARYGLKFRRLTDILRALNDQGQYLWHDYLSPIDKKVEQMKEILEKWKLA